MDFLIIYCISILTLYIVFLKDRESRLLRATKLADIIAMSNFNIDLKLKHLNKKQIIFMKKHYWKNNE